MLKSTVKKATITLTMTTAKTMVMVIMREKLSLVKPVIVFEGQRHATIQVHHV